MAIGLIGAASTIVICDSFIVLGEGGNMCRNIKKLRFAERGPTDEEFAWAIQRYYELMGWDEVGRPTPERLEKLDLAGLLAEIKY